MLFELLPYPMHIVITFLRPSKFYITSKNERPVTSTSDKVGGARLTRFMVMSTIEVQTKLRGRAGERRTDGRTDGRTGRIPRRTKHG